MLIQLSIRNIVLIESCELSLQPGLCVLSGETGAGKSILLDAFALVLGARADMGLLREGEAQGQVSAEFDISANKQVQHMLDELGMEASDTLIIRRSISADGKTRCHVNDQPVTVSAMKQLGESLVEVHGQHDQKTLMDMSLHRDMLDDYGRLATQRKATAEAYHAWQQEAQALAEVMARIEQAAREQDYLSHMRNELKQLAPQAGEEEQLTTRRTTMMQSEKLFEVLNGAIGELNGGKGVAASLRSAQRLLSRSPLTSGGGFESVLESLEKAAIEADEALAVLEKIGEESQFNPEALERIEERLFALKAAGRKYNLPVDELSALHKEVEDKLQLMDTQEHLVKSLQEKVDGLRKTFVDAAARLSAARQKASAKLEKAVQGELKPLRMENTRFRVRIEPLEESGWAEHGMDGVYFECATNVAKDALSIPYASLNKIASGGELSRFMLALKVALAEVRQSGTLIFDEIDAGTGGAVADAIGQRLSKLGEHAQVLVVTHLPQVAARGSQHLLVSKMQKGKKILTQVQELAPDARKEELARMLAGATITPEARQAAQKLLEDAA